MGIWNIHAALNFPFLLQQNIIHLFLSLYKVWMPKYTFPQEFLKPVWEHMMSFIFIIAVFHIMLSLIIRGPNWDTKWQDATWWRQSTDYIIVCAVFSANINFLFTWKVEWPSDNFGFINPSAVLWYSLSTSSKWMDLLMVLSSCCNTICSM